MQTKEPRNIWNGQLELYEFLLLRVKPPRRPVTGRGFDRKVWPWLPRARGSWSLYLWDKIPPAHKFILTACQGESLGARRANTGDSNIVVSPEAYRAAVGLMDVIGPENKQRIDKELKSISSFVDTSVYGSKYSCIEVA